MAMVALGGPVAEAMFSHLPDFEQEAIQADLQSLLTAAARRYVRSGASDDYSRSLTALDRHHHARSLGASTPGGRTEAWLNVAMKTFLLLRDRYLAVLDLADALIDRERLSRKEVEELIAGHGST